MSRKRGMCVLRQLTAWWTLKQMIKIKHGRRKNKPMRKEYYRGPIKISFHEAEKKISSTDRHNYH